MPTKKATASGDGTKAKPWKLKTPPGTSDYQMYRAEDLHAMLKKHGDWMPLGSADERMRAI